MHSDDLSPDEVQSIAAALRYAVNGLRRRGLLDRRQIGRLDAYARRWEAQAKIGRPVFVLAERLSTPLPEGLHPAPEFQPMQWRSLDDFLKGGGA